MTTTKTLAEEYGFSTTPIPATTKPQPNTQALASHLIHLPEVHTKDFSQLRDRVGRPTDWPFDHRNARILEDGRIRVAGQNFPFINSGLQTLCDRLGVPVGYMKRCPTDLAVENLNRWLGDSDGESVLRVLDGAVYGVVSPGYVALDHHQLLEAVGNMGNITLDHGLYSERRFHVRAFFPGGEMVVQPKVGDYIKGGVDIFNSENGYAQVGVAGWVLRLTCTNGATIRAQLVSFLHRHIHTTPDQLISQVHAAVHNIRAEMPRYLQTIPLLQTVEVDHAEEFRRLNDVYHLGKGAVDELEESWVGHPEDTQYGVWNAVTAVARDSEVEKRVRYEQIGGDILARFGRN